jgi:HSP20 family protein
MANLTRWDPFRGLARVDPFRDMGDWLNEFRLRPLWREFEPEPQIRIDVAEDEQAYTVKAEIPGVKKEDISVSLDGNQVTISAEVKKEKEEKKGERTLRTERYYGSVARSFALDYDVDEAKAAAKYEDGVLKLTLPKKSTAAVKKLPVT